MQCEQLPRAPAAMISPSKIHCTLKLWAKRNPFFLKSSFSHARTWKVINNSHQWPISRMAPTYPTNPAFFLWKSYRQHLDQDQLLFFSLGKKRAWSLVRAPSGNIWFMPLKSQDSCPCTGFPECGFLTKKNAKKKEAQWHHHCTAVYICSHQGGTQVAFQSSRLTS